MTVGAPREAGGKLRILHTEWSDGWGGQERRIASEMTGLARRGHHVVPAPRPRRKTAAKAAESGMPVLFLPMGGKPDLRSILPLARHLRREAIQVVNTPTGIAFDRFSPSHSRENVRQALNVPAGAFLVLMVGVIRSVKRHEVALRAFRLFLGRHPAACLVLAGEGPMEEQTKQLSAELGLGERARFLGHREDVPDLMAAADVLLLTSRSEGVPQAVTQALGLGVPVVATAAGGVPERVIHERTGLLVPPENPEAVAAALSRIADDPAEAAAGNPNPGLVTVSPATFRAHMKTLSALGYHALGAGDFLDFLLGKRDLPAKSVLITFDGGYLDNHVHAYPALGELGFEALYATRKDVNTGHAPPTDIGRLVTKDRTDQWLERRLFIYSSPLLGRLHGAVRGKT